MNRLEATNSAIPDKLHGLPEPVVELAALLAAGLENDVVLLHRIHQQASLVDILCEGFLAINVLPRTSRRQSDDHMHVIGCGNNHGIDVLTGDQIAEIDISIATFEHPVFLARCVALLYLSLRRFPTGLLHIANGHHLNILISQQSIEMATSHGTNANHSDGDALGGRSRAGCMHR